MDTKSHKLSGYDLLAFAEARVIQCSLVEVMEIYYFYASERSDSF